MFFVENLRDYRQENKNHFLSKDLKKKICFNIFCIFRIFSLY